MFCFGYLGVGDVPRFVKVFLDDLEASALALSCAGKQVVMISVDCCYINNDLVAKYLAAIHQATGLLEEHIFVAATHT